MATPGTGSSQISPDTPIVIKVAIKGANRKFKLPLRELNATNLPQKLRSILNISAEQEAIFERFSDSSASYLTLDSANPSTYKQLYRAAKAKLKLRLRVSFPQEENKTNEPMVKTEPNGDSHSLPAPPAAEPKEVNAPKPLPEVLQPKTGPNTHPAGHFRQRSEFVDRLVAMSQAREMGIRMKEPPAQPAPTFEQVFCNNCDKGLADAHFHCGICDAGDYDLCESCVNHGKLCLGEGHWLIKRFIKNGKIVNSTTERVPPRQPVPVEKEPEVPGAFQSEIKSQSPKPEQTRTCNSCVRILPENLLVECTDCDDYDLCMPCHLGNKHGHHPGHCFQPPTSDLRVNDGVLAACKPGRNVRHRAICDECDKTIHGVRHKCLDCPDWDFCHACHKNAAKIHPGHRFIPIYDPLEATVDSAVVGMVHQGIFCDGPLCSDKPHQSYIRGARYKCAICHDTDFCANCEAHPSNKHNATHPLIKFKTHIRGVAVTTTGDDGEGQDLPVMGDNTQSTGPQATADHPSGSRGAKRSTETLPAYTPVANAPPQASTSASNTQSSGLDAHFVRDAVVDGSSMSPQAEFYQTWTLRNPGPNAWPAGCSVKHVGGDNMLCLDPARPASVSELQVAQQSNVLGVSVPVGRDVDFTVKLRSPAREGKHISYWRMHDGEGMPFGHRLWCDIDSKTSSVPASTPAMNAASVATDSKSSVPSETPSLSKPNVAYQHYMDAMKHRLSAQREQLVKQAASAAAGKAWTSAPAVQPASEASSSAKSTVSDGPVQPNAAQSKAALPNVAQPNAVQPNTAASPAPVMPVINNAARFGMPHQMRLRAMNLQNEHSSLRQKWNTANGQPEERQKIAVEMKNLQAAMNQFAAVYRPPPQSLVPTENAEMRDLMLRQQNRRNEIQSKQEGEVKQAHIVANAQLDNAEMNTLVSKQRQRRHQLRNQAQAAKPAASTDTTQAQAPAKAPQAPQPTDAQKQQMFFQERERRMAMLRQQKMMQQAQAQKYNTMPGQNPQMPSMNKPQGLPMAQQHVAPVANMVPVNRMTQPTETPSPVMQDQAKAPTVEDIDAVTEEKLQKSDMVFPKLEKESPSSSTELSGTDKGKAPKEEVAAKIAISEAASSPAHSKAPSVDESDITTGTTTADVTDAEEDFESVTAEEVEVLDDAQTGVESDDEGAFTDDDYDILDASDEEAMEKAGQ